MVVVMVVTNRRGRLGPFLPPIDARTESGFAGAVVAGDPAPLVAYAPVVALLLLLLFAVPLTVPLLLLLLLVMMMVVPCVFRDSWPCLCLRRASPVEDANYEYAACSA